MSQRPHNKRKYSARTGGGSGSGSTGSANGRGGAPSGSGGGGGSDSDEFEFYDAPFDGEQQTSRYERAERYLLHPPPLVFDELGEDALAAEAEEEKVGAWAGLHGSPLHGSKQLSQFAADRKQRAIETTQRPFYLAEVQRVLTLSGSLPRTASSITTPSAAAAAAATSIRGNGRSGSIKGGSEDVSCGLLYDLVLLILDYIPRSAPAIALPLSSLHVTPEITLAGGFAIPPAPRADARLLSTAEELSAVSAKVNVMVPAVPAAAASERVSASSASAAASLLLLPPPPVSAASAITALTSDIESGRRTVVTEQDRLLPCLTVMAFRYYQHKICQSEVNQIRRLHECVEAWNNLTDDEKVMCYDARITTIESVVRAAHASSAVHALTGEVFAYTELMERYYNSLKYWLNEQSAVLHRTASKADSARRRASGTGGKYKASANDKRRTEDTRAPTDWIIETANAVYAADYGSSSQRRVDNRVIRAFGRSQSEWVEKLSFHRRSQ